MFLTNYNKNRLFALTNMIYHPVILQADHIPSYFQTCRIFWLYFIAPI